MKKIAIVGNPNVGKSVIFNNFTGTYVTVSNYPGTTVEVSRGKATIEGHEYEVIDTPGMYSLLPITEEERVARSILLNEKPDIVLHIVDAKNLERMLPMTLQLLESKLPVILVLNIMDEAERLGINIDINHLKDILGIEVIPTVSLTRQGMNLLKKVILAYEETSYKTINFGYDKDIENALENIEKNLTKEFSISKKTISMLLLQEDSEIHETVKEQEDNYKLIQKIINTAKQNYSRSLSYIIGIKKQQSATQIVNEVVSKKTMHTKNIAEKLSRITMSPISGIPILLIILYFGLYKFVGEFGAGTLVDFIETTIFEENINPVVINIVNKVIPWKILQELFVGEYGVITLGIRYAVALILPIVTSFFLVFSIIEDTGYLPRLAMLVDRIFKKIGLSGRAVIPMVLGLGCDTMATMVTRTLPTKRERIIATILLSLSIPCSAQLGVILALVSGNPAALALWLGIVLALFLLIGYLSAKVLPGEKAIFFMEIPPLRLPKISNILTKTYIRMKWYFMEVFPLFILASLFIWLGELTGVFDILVKLLSYPVLLVGLPEKTAVAFLFGFFRRDYGAAGLYDMQKAGLLNGNQLVIAVVMLTLFLPCIAQLLMTIKERGWKLAVAISAFILVFTFSVGYILNFLFKLTNLQI